jgi:hypothetical protein
LKQSMQVLTSSETNEWYTPPWVIGLVREVFGEIMLDPASNEHAQRWIKARRYYAIEDDGLSLPWASETLFLNPPYGKTGSRSNQEIWMAYLISQLPYIGSCIALTKTVPGYRWWNGLWRGLWPGPLCITSERISFVSPTGKTGKSKAASTFWYYGPDEGEFRAVFNKIGRVVEREKNGDHPGSG